MKSFTMCHLPIFILLVFLLSPVNSQEDDSLMNSSIIVNITLDGILDQPMKLSCLPYPENLPSEYGEVHQVIWRWENKKDYELPSTRLTESASRGGWKAIKNFTLFTDKLRAEHATMYECSVFNSKSILMYRHRISLIVKGPPSPPKGISIEALSESALKVTWRAGSDNNSSLKGHQIRLMSRIGDQEITKEINIAYPTLEYIPTQLEAFTVYSFQLRALNSVGYSAWSERLTAKTLPGKPTLQSVGNINICGPTCVSMTVWCSNPNTQTMKGEFRGYRFHVLSKQKIVLDEIIYAKDSNKINVTLSPLEPCTEYDVKVMVWNGRMSGPSTTHYGQTTVGLPDSAPLINTRDISSDSFTVYWPELRHQKCAITRYKVLLCSPPTLATFGSRCNAVNVNGSQLSHTFRHLRMHTLYNVRVAAGTQKGFGNYSEDEKLFTDIAPPPPPKIAEVVVHNELGIVINWTRNDYATPESLVSKNPNSVSEERDPTEYVDDRETIHVYYKVCWTIKSEEKCSRASENDTIVCDCDRSKPFQKAIVPWHLLSSLPDDLSDLKIGVKTMVYSIYCTTKRSPQCERLSETSTLVPIKLTAEHLQIIRGSAGSLGKIKMTIIITSAVLAVFLLCILVLTLFLREKCWYQGYAITEVTGSDSITYTRRSHSPVILPLGHSSHPPILEENFADHVARYHADDDAGYQAEFESIDRSVRTDYPSTIARLPENLSKNRYSNVFAYDHSRVLLHNGKKSDYINANYVDGYKRPQSFIATQGPMPSTFEDFWLMVWEQNTNVIVMISNFLERGRRKCDQYWPSEGSHNYGSISVQTVMQTELAYFTIRVFSIRNTRSTIKKSSRVRIVYHYQYTDWQDFDVPRSPLPVLAFVRSTVRHWHDGAGPIIVHCSAGVGRTGTYICIMSLVQQVAAERCVNVRAFLEHIRQQRMNLVQTEQQYAFIHDALREHLLFPQHECAKDNLSVYIRCLKEETSCGCTSLQKEFQLCIEQEPFDYEYTEARRACNISKNRSSVWPIEHCRVNLPGEPGVEGSNYINASHLSGYWSRGEFIVTQHPLPSTEIDFWKMVWDQNCSLIVFLSDPEMPVFWPTDIKESKDIGWLSVSFRNLEDLPQMCCYEFLLSSSREDYALVCQLWQMKVWPPNGRHPQSLDLTNLARNLTDLKKSTGPAIVVDNVGGNRGGIFCALNILVQQLIYESVVDVYFVVKMFHLQRPHIFQSYADLEFIYDTMDQYISSSDSHTKTSSANNTQDHNGSPPWIPLINAWVPPENFLSSPSETLERPQHQRHLSLPANPPNDTPDMTFTRDLESHLRHSDRPLENGHFSGPQTASVSHIVIPPPLQIISRSAPNRSPSPKEDGKLLI